VVTNAASAYDLLLISDKPGEFYRCLHAAGLLRRSPRLLSLLDPILAPTQIRLASDSFVVKASVVSIAAAERGASARRRDQFLAGRLFQDVRLVWARDSAWTERTQAAIASARRVTLDWVSPDLPKQFDSDAYVRQLFRTSFRFEVRPEARGRADTLFAAQSDRLVPIFEDVLQSLVSEGRLTRSPKGTFSLTAPVPAMARLRRRLFLEWSRVRATARWPKHAVTFDGWLDYIVKKAERHSGETITLSPLERRFPFLLLWPRALRFLSRQRKKGRPV
jgi:hypothetical protein